MKQFVELVFMIIMLTCLKDAYGQDMAAITISGNYNNAPLKNILKEFEERTDVRFSYLDQFVNKKYITVNFDKLKLSDALKLILTGTDLSYKIYNDSRIIVLFKSKTGKAASIPKFTISGYVEDARSGEKLMGANVFAAGRQAGTTTNMYGFFSLTLPTDSISFVISYMGYSTYYNPMLLNRDLQLNIQLLPSLISGDTIRVVYAEELLENRVLMSSVDVPVSQIQSLAELRGEMDILKTTQFTLDDRSGSQDHSGLYIRGGSPDQNLILIDGAPVYNVSHFLGLFPVFNPDAIKNIKITRGGFPARFGGRISSVVEINTKEGNNKEYNGFVSVGFLASRFTVEGPIVKDKSSFIISGRRTYMDVLGESFLKYDDLYYNPSFYDLNAKINCTFSQKDRIYLSVYSGNDRFSLIEKDTEYQSNMNSGWENITSTLRWNHIVNKKLFSNTTLTYSKYRFDVKIKNESKDIIGQTEASYFEKYDSKIQDWSSRIDFNYLPDPDHNIRFGGSFTYHIFSPGILQFDEKTEAYFSLSDRHLTSEKIFAQEYSAYFEDEVKFNHRMSLNFGLHSSFFAVNEKLYSSLQPRISVRYKLGNQFALKSSYAAMAQYIHLLTNNNIGLPTDLWLPVTNRIEPLRSNQVALGVAKSIRDKQLEFSVEIYSKTLDNLLTYQDGKNTLSSTNTWQDTLAVGTGYSYGIELFLQKKHGATTGLLGYNLSWTNKKFAAFTFGKEFPYRYDRRHNINIALTHNLTSKIEFSANWIYGTGDAFSLPGVQYVQTVQPTNQSVIKDEVFYANETRKNFRIRAYHRLDINIRLFIRKKNSEQMLTVSFYNLYNRKNPYFLHFDDSSNEKIEIKQVSLFPIIPLISYSFTF